MSTGENAADRDEIREFVSCVFDNWFGLQAAISHGMGGNSHETSKRLSQLTDRITNMCCSPGCDEENIAETLEDLVDEYFSTEFEDGSVDEVAALLWNYKQDWFSGKKDSIKSYVAAKREGCHKTLLKKLEECDSKMDTDEEDSEDNISTQSSTLPSPPSVDPDGWTIPRHNRRRNH